MNRHFKKATQEFAPTPSQDHGVPLMAEPLGPTVDLGRKRARSLEQAATTPTTAATTPLSSCTVISGAHSVTGSRQKNEDAYLIDATRRLWAVSDGIGGAPFGEVISRVSCNYAPRAWDANPNATPVQERLASTITQVNDFVSDLSDLLGRKGSGATLTLAHYDGRTAYIASVGDTKAYLLHEGTLSQVSGDGRVSQLTNALDQALGYHINLNPTFTSFEPVPGDVLALCTDGVWATQTLPRIQTALEDGLTNSEQIALDGNPQHMAYRLVEGSDMSDNATAVVVLFDRGEEFALFTPSLG